MEKGKKSCGFTLVELLVVITIIATLALLLSSVLGAARARGDQTAALSMIRQMGTAILLHAGDHDGTLPGPMWPGQVAEFDATNDARLVVALAQYLGIDPAGPKFLIEDLIPPAYKRAVARERWDLGRVYVLNMNMPNVEGETDPIAPFGNRAVSVDERPMKMVSIPQEARESWVMSDADQEHPAVAAAGWRTNTPETPIHGKKRTNWFFDGSARMLDLDAN